ncbi:SAM-dependent methyltransferase [Streptomyces sp. LBL]|uniref:class I SAM-dependent methyltransferase n=1 Tax=Streptomyces sp. LBL TaxID=2940562 RepID=UPI0024757491|nr:class I SAM-dependent methyltransferase [Streptomyces sp. LBL]MDH6630488.1 SAM-dependent methyltransferase [Streptomyces sp. LBL]
MHTQTSTSATSALDPVPPFRTATAITVQPYRLPGLESLAEHSDDQLWLQDALLGPFSGDIVGYLGLARSTGGPVLDLGSGAGRLAVPFACHGFEVEAVDRHAESLRRLQARAEDRGRPIRDRMTTTCSDLTRLHLRESYQLVLLAGTLIAAVAPSARLGFFHSIAAHVGRGGALAFDYTAHDTEALSMDPVRNWTFQVPRFDGVTEWVVAQQVFDPAAMKERITYYSKRSGTDGTHGSITSTVKWIVDEVNLTQDLHAAGLCVVERRQRRLDNRTRSVMLVCRCAA